MKTIKLGDVMPDPCKKCGLKYGYQVTDNVRGGYTIMYTGDGDVDGGAYTDSMYTSKFGTRAYCSNCGNDLKLKVDRT